MDKEIKKIIFPNNQFKPFSVINETIIDIKQKLLVSFDKVSKLKNLNIYCQCLEDFIKNYMLFIDYNESIYEKVYKKTEELFNCYL